MIFEIEQYDEQGNRLIRFYREFKSTKEAERFVWMNSEFENQYVVTDKIGLEGD